VEPIATTGALEVIYGRRSVRSYLPQDLTAAQVHALLDAAVQAPSALDAQPWTFAVVQNRETLRAWSDRAKVLLLARARTHPGGERYADLLRDRSFNIFHDAGTLIVICGPSDDPFATADCWLAAQNVQLAARALGLGTCCIGFALPLLQQESVRAELAIPLEQVALAALIAGVPRAEPAPVPRDAPVILSWLR
jgi:nitroreductase